jgi:hypothetical protein
MLPQQTRVNQHPKRHPAVHRGLKLEQKQQIPLPAAVQRNPPNDVAVAPLAVHAIEAGVQPFQTGQVEVRDPGFVDEIAQKLHDHFGMAEQAMIQAVVVGHGPEFSSDPDGQ